MQHSKSGSKSVMNTESNRGWILLPEQIEALKNNQYMYNATAGSFLELLFLQKFWMWLVKFVPASIAPCSLTCLGLAINVFCAVLLLCYCPNFENDIPSWTSFLCAIGIFLYQTLDALDGKQAIKVQNTQIEELYDHGCDALSTVFVSLIICVTCRLGTCPFLMFLFFLISVVAFYTTHWEDHVTHVMIFGKIDVSEAQCTMIAIHVLTGIFGQNIWGIKLFYFIEMRHLLGLAVLASLSRLIVANVAYICGRRTSIDEFVVMPRKTGLCIWNPFLPAAVLTICFVRVFTSGTFEVSPCLSMLAFGLAYTKITIKLVTSNVTDANMDIWDSGLVAPILIFLNTYLSIIPISTALLCGLVYNLMDLARYFTYVSWDMKEALDIWIFSVKYPPGHPKCRNGNEGCYMNGINNNEVKEELVRRSSRMSELQLAKEESISRFSRQSEFQATSEESTRRGSRQSIFQSVSEESTRPASRQSVFQAVSEESTRPASRQSIFQSVSEESTRPASRQSIFQAASNESEKSE